MAIHEMNEVEFRSWLREKTKDRFRRQSMNRDEVGAPEPSRKHLWLPHVPQCPDRGPDGRKCRLKADHPAHDTNQHAGWKKKGKAKSWSIWSSELTGNFYGAVRNWKKANKSGQQRFSIRWS